MSKEHEPIRGRPRKYTDVEALDYKIEEYFDSLDDGEQPTITGLTLHLGFSNKRSLYDYAENKTFSHSIKSAITKIEHFHEKKLYDKEAPTAGVIFALKNFGWTDRQEIDHTTNGKDITPPIKWTDDKS